MVLQVAFERELECEYRSQRDGYREYWPAHKECLLTSLDLSDAHKSETHSFTGRSSDKSGVSLVNFHSSKVVDFVPAEVTREFQKLNALVFTRSNVPIVKTGLFGRDFIDLQFLGFVVCKVQSIEAGAFIDLQNLKLIYFYGNPLKTLQFGLFRNNLKLEIARFNYNKISTI
jgi:hypothetical protein